MAYYHYRLVVHIATPLSIQVIKCTIKLLLFHKDSRNIVATTVQCSVANYHKISGNRMNATNLW